ncbi:hypothetical protein RvY_02651 [Ramazzottius varieornatus]|uniref:Uncharacterized protein n=1 Tax=Ramazzottius varieornatus TaxID=947166 RepID=A0A1D1UNW0_RAMVA|nr:hypothetical protein RvY_02651 [Ramazzottius varieornatus]
MTTAKTTRRFTRKMQNHAPLDNSIARGNRGLILEPGKKTKLKYYSAKAVELLASNG